MSIDIPALTHKLRTAPRKVGTFGRGDPNPLDEYRVILTAEERDWLVALLEKHGRAAPVQGISGWAERLDAHAEQEGTGYLAKVDADLMRQAANHIRHLEGTIPRPEIEDHTKEFG